MKSRSVDVLIVGGGPSGLTAARKLASLGVRDVLVVDRENEAGGIPRHSDHTGYGLRDLHSVMTGPTYARTLVQRAERSGVQIQTNAMVTGWADARTLEVTSPQGRERITARAIILATGARERPRTARRIPGDRPAGVLTTGQLQNLVHVHHQAVGDRAVIVGSELVSWSAVLTLREAGCQTVLMTTEFDKPEAYRAFSVVGKVGLRVPISTRTQVVRVLGKERVRGVELVRTDTGARRVVPCDVVVFTGNWIPDHELVRLGGGEIDPYHLGPVVDSAGRTTMPGVFAAGNLMHPVDTADVAALDGAHVAQQVHAYVTTRSQNESASWPTTPSVRIVPGGGLLWVSPSSRDSRSVAPARGRVLSWPTVFRTFPTVEIRQDDHVIGRQRLLWPASPGRVFRIPWSLFEHVSQTGGDVVVSIV